MSRDEHASILLLMYLLNWALLPILDTSKQIFQGIY